jgi:hypothetical protein
MSNNISQTAKKSAKPLPSSAAVKLPPKAVLTRNIFAPLRTTDMNMETTGAENTLPEQDTPRKSSRPPPIMVTSTTNLNRLQSDLKPTSKERSSSKYTKWKAYHNKRNDGLISHEILSGQN